METTTKMSAHPRHRDWSQIPVEQIEAGIERQMIVGEKLMVCRLRFAPHVVTPAHDHPHEQITFVERGRVLFTIGEEQRVAVAGDVLHFPPGSWHGATMLDEEVILIDIFSPVREDFLDSTQRNGQKA
jgi:quercetin dioxygenase-like cupin family protein